VHKNKGKKKKKSNGIHMITLEGTINSWPTSPAIVVLNNGLMSSVF
jgi:hypothetical protein